MQSLFTQDLTSTLTVTEQQSALRMSEAITAFIEAQGEDPGDYPDLLAFVRSDLFEPYYESSKNDPDHTPFFNVGTDGYFIESINFISAFCCSGGKLSSFSNRQYDTVDNIDIIGRAIYHGAHTVATWFSTDTSFDARFKALGLLVATLPEAVSSLAEDMYQYGGMSSPRPDLLWLGHDSLHHVLTGELIPDNQYQGTLSNADRHQMVNLELHESALFKEALARLKSSIAMKGDDKEVRKDHLQHIIALSIYTPVFMLINQGVSSRYIERLVRERASILMQGRIPPDRMKGTINQILFNALSISPDHLHQVFSDTELWVSSEEQSATFAKGPIMAFAGHNAEEVSASMAFYTHHYGAGIKEKLATRIFHESALAVAMVNSGCGYLPILDQTLKTSRPSLNAALKIISAISAHPGAWAQYCNNSVKAIFQPLMEYEFRGTMGTIHANKFRAAMINPDFKKHVIESLGSQNEISQFDLDFTGLLASDLGDFKHKLRQDDLEKILQSELGL